MGNSVQSPLSGKAGAGAGADVEAVARDRRGGLAYLPLAAVILLPALLAWPTTAGLVALWHGSYSYAHGWLIALVTLYLVVEVAADLGPARGGAVPALGVLLVVSLLYVVARFAAIEIAAELLLPALMLSLAAVFYGGAGARRLAFPLGFLVFAIPLWDFVIPLLQRLTVLANGALLPLVGVPALINGDLVQVPAGLFEVAGGCSGVHFFIVALAIGSLYAYLRQGGLRATLWTVGLAVAIALVTNWLRVFWIIVRGNQTAMHTSLIKDHYWFGWWLFAAALTLYFVILQRVVPGALPAAPPRRPPGMAGTSALVVGTALLAAVLGWGERQARALEALPAPVFVEPGTAGGFAGPLIGDTDFRPVFPGASGERLATYQGPHGRVGLYQVAYGRQRLGEKLIGYDSSVVPAGWREESRGRRRLPDGAEVELVTVRRPDGGRAVILDWYVVGGRATASAATARLRLAGQAFTAVTHSRLFALESACTPDCDVAAGDLTRFAAILLSQRDP